ncbi:MAG: hypothetical protein K1X94_28860 [Sandaracinaceae bacterium]|nr:hypothetical protein [Sandaracinaceae bacterium]
MRRPHLGLLVCLVALVACGGGGASSSTSGTTATASHAPASSGPDGCMGHDPSREAMCLSEGCRWGQSLLCMGTAPSPDHGPDGPRPCDCICPDDEEACRSVPAAAPAE